MGVIRILELEDVFERELKTICEFHKFNDGVYWRRFYGTEQGEKKTRGQTIAVYIKNLKGRPITRRMSMDILDEVADTWAEVIRMFKTEKHVVTASGIHSVLTFEIQDP